MSTGIAMLNLNWFKGALSIHLPIDVVIVDNRLLAVCKKREFRKTIWLLIKLMQSNLYLPCLHLPCLSIYRGLFFLPSTGFLCDVMQVLILFTVPLYIIVPFWLPPNGTVIGGLTVCNVVCMLLYVMTITVCIDKTQNWDCGPHWTEPWSFAWPTEPNET